MEPMQLVDRALQRSRHWLDVAVKDFPVQEMASKQPGGEAKAFDQIMHHLVGCDLWFLSCAKIGTDDAPHTREQIEAVSGEELVAMAQRVREYTLEKIHAAGTEALAEPPERYKYPSRLDLWLYAAEHEFWHAGQVQALALNQLLASVKATRLSQPAIVGRVGLWGLVAFLLAIRISVQATWRIRPILAGGFVLILASLLAAMWLSNELEAAWAVETLLASCSMAAVCAVVVLVNLVHQRQLHLTPGLVWSADGTTASATSLAATASPSPGSPRS